ncbi:MAG TPA: M17 family peptidase N-terminal domain-containing protein [Tepidisphaeraceae bacterium]|jgi:hypothetical protein|nr:M17 family peptidase N-terminal domain-containing protein [Tepidisphaeraceae bacterium]
MKTKTRHIVTLLPLLMSIMLIGAASPSAGPPAEQRMDAPNGMQISVKMIGPVTQTTDLQIICVLKHDPAGDKYIEAMADFNDKLGGLLSNLRERGEFVGESGETLLFTPPPNSITPRQVLLIGVGEESELTIEKLKLAGKIAARQAVLVRAAHVSFAPTLRDQGSSRIDVGEGDAAVAGQVVLAYDTQMRLAEQGLAPKMQITDFIIEAGPKYFDGAAQKVRAAVAVAADQVKARSGDRYVKTAAR